MSKQKKATLTDLQLFDNLRELENDPDDQTYTYLLFDDNRALAELLNYRDNLTKPLNTKIRKLQKQIRESK